MLVAMSAELDAVGSALFNNQVSSRHFILVYVVYMDRWIDR